jgi:hypothetical protein
MDAQIRITGGTGGELADLGGWLGGDGELRGRVRAVRSPIGDAELGSVTELLTVALGAGGAGTVLASSLKTWLMTRRTTAKSAGLGHPSHPDSRRCHGGTGANPQGCR